MLFGYRLAVAANDTCRKSTPKIRPEILRPEKRAGGYRLGFATGF